MVRTRPLRASIGGILLTAPLLTGCGSEDDDAAASSSSGASTGAPADSSPSSAPGSDATLADYVPASLDGPAQNVPKPVLPDLAREESREGAQAFLDHWSDAMWYAYQTGDTSYARDVISQHCDVCMDQLDLLEEIYDSGAWATGGRESVTIQESAIRPAADGVYKPIVSGTAEGAQLIEDGQVTLDVPPDDGVDDPHIIYLDYAQGAWVYISAANLPGAEYANS